MELSNPISLPILLFRVSRFLKTNPRLNFDEVVDTTFARHLSLREHSQEFLKRKEKSIRKVNGRADAIASRETKAQLPMLASACPGWVCYAEKAQHELLDLVSTTKSPMLMSGVLAKRWSSSVSSGDDTQRSLQSSQGQSSSPRKRRKVFHLSVMPCYDKKLESARPSISSTEDDRLDEELLSSLKEEAEKDVDLVLTTGELVKLMADENFDLEAEVEGEVELFRQLQLSSERSNLEDLFEDQDHCIPTLLKYPSLHSGSSSGGYLFSILQTAWSHYLEALPSSSTACTNPSSSILPTLLIRTIRNSDYTEYILKSPPLRDQGGRQELLFKGAHCYGFRNLQNLVRKVKTHIKKEVVTEAPKPAQSDSSGRGRAARGRMAGRGGRGGKMVKRGGGNTGSSSKITLDDDFSSPVSSTLASNGLQEQPQEVQAPEEEDAFSSSVPYDYVEIMACPGGCVNGGGQLRPPAPGSSVFLNGKETKQLLGGDAASGPTGSFASGIGRESEMTEAQVNNENTVEKLKADSQIEFCSDRMQPDPSEIGSGDLGEGEEPEEISKKGWKGTSKQWVGKVEEAYWKTNLKGRSASPSTTPGLSDGEEEETRSGSSRNSSGSISTPPTSLSSSIFPPPKSSISSDLRARLETQLVIQTTRAAGTAVKSGSVSRSDFDFETRIESLTDRILDEICRSHLSPAAPNEAFDGIRGALLHTRYNAVKDEAVSGLAVQW